MKKIAHCIHHTHWDLIWYFTVQDATVQFSYNMKELLIGFQEGRIQDFFLDGQTAPLDEYLALYPEDEAMISELVKSGKLIVGPFNSQLDCFICSGESIINNLRLGIKTAKRLGKVSNVAYLPDSFGHSYDFPKIFQSFGIKDFVITRGVGDEYGLGSEFFLRSNDGSEVLVCTMIAGYGYGCYAFREGTLFQDSAQDYNKIPVKKLIERLLQYSTLENEFVFPLGFDQNPVIMDIAKRIKQYNESNEEITFNYTTWQNFCDHVRANGKDIKTYEGEIHSTQYHRIHRSIFSGRADIKALQDRCERMLTYELQPLSAMLDNIGIAYSHALIDACWEKLVKCQTHSSANLTDETNDYIRRETQNVLNQVIAHKAYLYKLMSISLEKEFYQDGCYPLLVFNTLPYGRTVKYRGKVLTKTPHFRIHRDDNEISYVVLQTQKKNHGVLRKDPTLIDQQKNYYETEVLFQLEHMKGMSYETLKVVEEENPVKLEISHAGIHQIEDKYYIISADAQGIRIEDKINKRVMERAIYLEESGDEGDSFDYSYPSHDLILHDFFNHADIQYTENELEKRMVIEGSLAIPQELSEREKGICNSELGYHLEFVLGDKPYIEVEGKINNKAKAHRVRLVFATGNKNDVSYAGTQYSVVTREVRQQAMEYWREEGWFEEPSAQWPLLNHVSAIHGDVTTVYTKSSKEYELIGPEYQDIAVTLFRSYGAMAYPDLNRRPGRPSGLDYRIFETPQCQMIGENEFKLAVGYANSYQPNEIVQNYVEYATESMCFEGQKYDKSQDLILYFPTNALEHAIPQKYSMFQLEAFQGCYGTVVKEDEGNGYLLRIFNCAEETIETGSYTSDYFDTLDKVMLNGEVVTEGIEQLPKMRKGELLNLKMRKGGRK